MVITLLNGETVTLFDLKEIRNYVSDDMYEFILSFIEEKRNEKYYEIDSLNEELNECESYIDELETENRNLEELLEDAENEVEKLNKQIDKIRSVINENV